MIDQLFGFHFTASDTIYLVVCLVGFGAAALMFACVWMDGRSDSSPRQPTIKNHKNTEI